MLIMQAKAKQQEQVDTKPKIGHPSKGMNAKHRATMEMGLNYKTVYT